MSRRASVDSPQPSSPHPVLTAALGCMDVQLEAELARYRRRKAEEQGRDRPTSNAIADSYPQLSTIDPTPHQFGTAIAPPSPVNAVETSPLVPPELQTESASSPPLAHPTEADSAPLSQVGEQPQEALSDPASTQLPPDDYLASSEQLLRNLDRPQPQPQPTPSLIDYLLTPLGIGAMLVLLIATTLLGAALVEPEMAARLGFNRFFKSESETSTGNSTLDPSASDRASGVEGDSANTDEALDLDNLSKIQPSPNSSNPTQTNPAVPAPVTPAPPVAPPNLPAQGSSSGLTRALIPPNGAPTAPQAQPSPEPTPAPQAAAPAPQAAPKSGDPYYFVIVPYTGPGSLQQAQAVVPDAYPRKFKSGVSIQMGALPARENAERLVEQLKQQGLSASVYSTR